MYQFDLLLDYREVKNCTAYELGMFKNYEDLTVATPNLNAVFINSEFYVVDLITRDLVGIG